MAKYCGKVGYVDNVEVESGIYKDIVTEKLYYGDIIKNYTRRNENGQINDDISLNNSISILADPYAYKNFSKMKYVEFMGVKWKINGVEAQHPRLIISLGGLYND